MRLAYLQRAETAVALIRRQMRTSIVSRLTGIAPERLRALRRDIHDRKAPSGQLPSTGRILSNRARQATASLFAALYRAVGGPRIFNTVDLDALVDAHDLYLDLSRELTRLSQSVAPIDLTQAWVISRDIRIGVVSFRLCRRCRVHYLIADDCPTALTCPLCALRKRRAPKRSARRRPHSRQQ